MPLTNTMKTPNEHTEILLGERADGPTAAVTLEVLNFLKTRMLITANSGGGKSWLMRRIAEQLCGIMPVIIIDPEGEFKTLREKFDFVLIGPEGEAPADCRSAKFTMLKMLELRTSAIFDLSELAPHEKHRFVRLISEAAIDSPKELWRSTTFIFDEAHIFCPENGKGQSEARAAVLGFPTKGRKRNFGCIFATQRLAKLAMDARAEMLNRIVGMMIEPDDIAAAAGILGVTDRQNFSRQMRTIPAGVFHAFGRAIGNESVLMKVGPVQTSHEVQTALHGVKAPPAPSKIKNLLPQLADLPKQAEEEANTLAEAKEQIRALKTELATARRNEPKTETTVKTVKERILTPAESKRLTALLPELAKLTAGIAALPRELERLAIVGDRIKDESAKLAAAIAPKPTPDAKPALVVSPDQARLLSDSPKEIQFRCDSKAGKTAGLNQSEPKNGEIKLSGSIGEILRCIADGGAIGVEDDEIAIMTSLKTTSRNVYKRQLAAAGYIVRDGNRCFITPLGVDALGGSWTPLPKGAALREYWLGRLTGGELSLFRIFCEAYPAEVSNEELMRQTGLMTTSINVYKRKLKARRLIDGNKAVAGLF